MCATGHRSERIGHRAWRGTWGGHFSLTFLVMWGPVSVNPRQWLRSSPSPATECPRRRDLIVFWVDSQHPCDVLVFRTWSNCFPSTRAATCFTVSCGVCKHSVPTFDELQGGQGQKVKVRGVEKQTAQLASFLRPLTPGWRAASAWEPCTWQAARCTTTSWFSVVERSRGSPGLQCPEYSAWHKSNRPLPRCPASMSVWLSVHRWWVRGGAGVRGGVGSSPDSGPSPPQARLQPGTCRRSLASVSWFWGHFKPLAEKYGSSSGLALSSCQGDWSSAGTARTVPRCGQACPCVRRQVSG